MGRGRRGGGRGQGGGRGRGRGGEGGGDDFDGGGGGGREDQYGGFSSQDRDDRSQFSGKSSTGGGSAGGSSKPEANLTFKRQVPKFLQRYQHMLGGRGGAPSEDEPTVDDDGAYGASAAMLARKGYGDDEDYEDDRGRSGAEDGVELEALKRAMADNPALAKEFESTLAKRLSQAEAVEEKERGNKLFGEKKYREAIKSFTRCIELDPSNEVFYSNRSAAHASLEEWQRALEDGQRAASLRPGWAKAHQRVGVAYFGLDLFSEAKEAYEKAAKLEPDDQAIHAALQKAEMLELQQARDKKHVFKKHRSDAAVTMPAGPSSRQVQPAAAKPAAAAGKAPAGVQKIGAVGNDGGKKRSLLSFEDDG